jgi:hypothetical protein
MTRAEAAVQPKAVLAERQKMLAKAAKEAKTEGGPGTSDCVLEGEGGPPLVACWSGSIDEGILSLSMSRRSPLERPDLARFRNIFIRPPKWHLERACGAGSLISQTKQQEGAAIDTLVLHGRLNDGKTRLEPPLSSKQVAQALRTTTEKWVNAGELKSKRVATQATTTK